LRLVLFLPPKLDTREQAVLARVRQLWADLYHSLDQRPTKWTGLLARNQRAKAIQGSNSIEGYFVSDDAALAALDGDRPEETDETSWVNVVRYREAMDYVLQLADDATFTYSPQLLKSLHFMMMRHRPDKHPGLWRPGAIYVRNEATGDIVYEGPPDDAVEGLVAELCDELTRGDGETQSRMIRAAMAHLNLVMVHPFSDGNGRMARCLQTLVLARGRVLNSTFSSIEEYLGRNTATYYDVLARVGAGSWSPRNDTLPWIRFCLTAHYRQAMSVKRRLERISFLSDEVERLLSSRGLPDRSAVSLVNAVLGFKIRNESYRREADVGITTASRDLRQLCDAELIVAEGERRGRRYRAGSILIEISQPAGAKPPIADPFES
jgi:Fic family protein